MIVRDLSINMTFRKIEKNLTEKVLNVIKDKIKLLATDAMK